jgi:NAD(P)-dependent dehydrogenase (short-subunit alcohol dehydrogenase family)
VITGGGSGLGRALALRLAARRARILVADVDLASAEETCALVAAAGGSATAFACDVARLADVEAAAQAAEERFGGTDLLVNNAGVAVAGLVGELPISDWEWILRVNLCGVIHGCHVFVPRMRARRRGFLLNVASTAGFASLPEMAPYNVTKAGIISLSETLHAELAASNIAVSCLCPTFFKSNLLDRLRSPGRQRALAELFFRGARATAEEVAEAALSGLERGELIVIPQLDGSMLWRTKRYAPSLYHAALRMTQRLDVAGRLSRPR